MIRLCKQNPVTIPKRQWLEKWNEVCAIYSFNNNFDIHAHQHLYTHQSKYMNAKQSEKKNSTQLPEVE